MNLLACSTPEESAEVLQLVRGWGFEVSAEHERFLVAGEWWLIVAGSKDLVPFLVVAVAFHEHEETGEPVASLHFWCPEGTSPMAICAAGREIIPVVLGVIPRLLVYCLENPFVDGLCRFLGGMPISPGVYEWNSANSETLPSP